MMSLEGLKPNHSKIDDKLTQKEWLEFLNNYNERYFTRQQASGFTLWALVGVLVFLCSELLKSLSNITNDFFLFSVFFTILLNCYSVFLCAVSVLSNDNNNNYIESNFLKKWTDLYIPLYSFVVTTALVLSWWQSEFVRSQGFMPYGYFLQAGIYGRLILSAFYIDTFVINSRIISQVLN